jgi:hypothetical protein
MRSQPTDGEKIFAKGTLGKTFLSKIDKVLLKLNRKTTIKNRQKT